MADFIQHPFGPMYDEKSRILVLGSFPSVKSREQTFFYGHPQNRYWPLVASLLQEEVPAHGDIEAKRHLALSHGIAMWDVIQSCRIEGSSDSTIEDVTVNDIRTILQAADIRQIFCNGTKSYELYQKYTKQLTGRDAVKLTSTSPANAAWNLPRLQEAWKVILPYLF